MLSVADRAIHLSYQAVNTGEQQSCRFQHVAVKKIVFGGRDERFH